MKKLLILLIICILAFSCYAPKKDAQYDKKEPIRTSSPDQIELIITEERFSEPAVPVKEKDGILQPIVDWHSREMLEYHIGPGDMVRVTILVSLDANSYEVTVSPDGTIVLPLVGRYTIDGLTEEEAREGITKVFEDYYINPQIQLKVVGFNSQSIYIVGETSESKYKMQKRVTLFEVINSINLDPNTTDLEGSYLMRDGKIIPLHLDRLLEGDLTTNYELKNQDILFLPKVTAKKVYLFGEVYKPGMYEMGRDENVFSLLARAGGPRVGAQLREIRIIRGGLVDPVLLTLNIHPLLKRRPAAQFNTAELNTLAVSVEATRKNAVSLEKLYLHDGDIIVVPPTALRHWNQIMEMISPTLTFGISRPLSMARDVIYLNTVL